MRGELGIFAVLAALLAVLFWPEPVAVDVAEIGRGRMVESVAGEGIAHIRQVYEITAPLAGRLQRIALEPGAVVRAGQEVARLRPAPPEFLDRRDHQALAAAAVAAAAAAEAAAAAVEAAAAALAFAEADARRVEILAAEQVEPLAERDRLRRLLAERRAGLAAAQAERLAAEAACARLQALLRQPGELPQPAADLLVTAPTDGVVLRVLRTSETVVAAGTPLLTLGDARDIEIVLDLPSAQAARLRPGLPADVTRWGGTVLPARVRSIEPAGRSEMSLLGFEEQRVAVILDILAPPAAHAGLAHGFRADVRIELGQGDGLLVPLGALLRHDGGWAVYVVQDGRARRRPLRLGRFGPDMAEVLDGLAAGERVVVYPGEHVADGVTVRVR